MNDRPAWPRRPPLGVSLALLASVALGAGYCWATVRLTKNGDLIPLYVEADLRMRAVFPDFQAMFHPKPKGPVFHRFVFPDRSAVTVPAAVMYASLRRNGFAGKSVARLFAPAGIGFVLTFIGLVCWGGRWDRRHVSESRAGRLLRGPRIVAASSIRGDGLRFEVK